MSQTMLGAVKTVTDPVPLRETGDLTEVKTTVSGLAVGTAVTGARVAGAVVASTCVGAAVATATVGAALLGAGDAVEGAALAGSELNDVGTDATAALPAGTVSVS